MLIKHSYHYSHLIYQVLEAIATLLVAGLCFGVIMAILTALT